MTQITKFPWKTELNPEQYDAVTHGEGPQLVIAGAGSGKTRVITYRVAWLIHEQEVDPRAVLAVTFTNKAAGEMRERIEKLLGLSRLSSFVGTFHRLSLDLLRKYGERVGVPPSFAIFDTDDQKKLVKQALKDEKLDPTRFPPRPMLTAISAAKNEMVGPDAFAGQAEGFFQERVARVYRRYQKLLEDAGGVDFDDMLVKAVRLVATQDDLKAVLRERVQYMMVDEFQDTNKVQLTLVRELIGEGGNLTAVGDEDQGIYRWRGADLDNILQFEKFFPGATVHKLERNYRSTGNILAAAGAVVGQNRLRRGKNLWTEGREGELLELYRAGDEQDEARWIVRTIGQLKDDYLLQDIAILVRTNAQTRSLEEQLIRAKIPYSLVAGVRFYERAEVKDAVAYLRVLRNPDDDVSLDRILNTPARGIGKTTHEALKKTAKEFGTSQWGILTGNLPRGIATRSLKALERFRDLILELQESLEVPPADLINLVLDRSGYGEFLRGKGDEAESRLENLQEFASAAQQFEEDHPEMEDLLGAFLDHAALVSDIDGWHPEKGVSLMTLHAAKGLEFKAVFVAGLEDGVLPHFNAGEVPENVEEERRLFYVGMTRARERLFLSCCRRRRVAGRYKDQLESPFLDEVPEKYLVVHRSPELFSGRSRGAASYFRSSGGRKRFARAGADPQARRASERLRRQTYGRGRKVRHASLGDGVVLDVEGSGDDSKLTIFFEHAGRKKLVAKYAELEWM